jgi:N-methylhydantoinase A
MKRAAIDVGGTFTDCLILDEKTGSLQAFKAPTTPHDPSAGLLHSLEKAARASGKSLGDYLREIDLIIHGTTLATNALLTGRGVKTGMLTTKNFRDIIEYRRGYKNIRTSMFHVHVPPYEPLVPRWRRLGIEERTLWNGEMLTPLNEEDLRRSIETLKAEDVKAVAVCFLHSYANPENERRAAETCQKALPNAYVTSSHQILPVWREYERFSTTVVSAYIGPIVASYLTELELRLKKEGFGGALLMVLSSGLVETAEYCVPRAVFLIGSGPAAAPSAGVYVGETRKTKNLISIDMGGTSFEVCLIRNGEIPTSTETWVGDERVAIKMVSTHSVGAGGGSIAWIDSLGLLRVGPQSAAADPGPASYAKGGMEPTVTDADLLLGYVPHDFFLGGEIALDVALAKQAIKKVADPLHLTLPDAAQAIFTTVNSFMADQITEVSTKQGYDVRDFALVVGGGAGPVHGAFIADHLGIPTVIIPTVAALLSAFGMFAMDIGRDFARSYFVRAGTVDLNRVNRLFREMEEDAHAAIRAMRVAEEGVVLRRTVELRYIGQFHEVEVPLPPGEITKENLDEAVQSFHTRHEELYTFRMPWKGVEFLNFRLKATAPKAPFTLRQIGDGNDPSGALKRKRACLFGGREVETPVYDGEKLRKGNEILGPAIIEERTTTVVVPERYRCSVDEYRNYVLTRSR